MNIYDFSDYKTYVTARVENMPQKGHGQYRKMAAHLNASSVQVSHVFRGDRHLTDEQALDVGAFFGLSEAETHYFITLVQKERAGNYRLKNYYAQKIEELRQHALATRNRFRKDLELEGAALAVYYSEWYYSGVRLALMLPGCDTAPAIAEKLNLPLSTVQRALAFLNDSGLVEELPGERFKSTLKNIFLDKTSPLITRFHSNWRMKAIENMADLNDAEEMFFTCPLTLPVSLAAELRARFRDIIADLMARTEDVSSEQLHCLNIDWFRVKR